MAAGAEKTTELCAYNAVRRTGYSDAMGEVQRLRPLISEKVPVASELRHQSLSSDCQMSTGLR